MDDGLSRMDNIRILGHGVYYELCSSPRLQGKIQEIFTGAKISGFCPPSGRQYTNLCYSGQTNG